MFRHEDVASLASSVASRNQKRVKSTTSSDLAKSSDKITAENSKVRHDIISGHVLQQLADMDAMYVEKCEIVKPLGHDTLSYWQEKAPILVLSLFSARKGEHRIFGVASFLPRMILEADGKSCMRLCCDAVATALLANRIGTTDAESIRDEAYGAALNATHLAVGDAKSRGDDETIVSVWLLGIYELIKSSLIQHAAPTGFTWKEHADGVMQLLHARGMEQMEREQGTKIFWLLISLVQIRCLTTMEGDLIFLKSCLSNVIPLNHIRSADLLEATEFTNETIDAVVRINSTLSQSRTHQDQSGLRTVLTDTIDLEASQSETVLDSALQHSMNLFDVTLINQYRVSYIRMLQLVLELVEMIQSHETIADGDFLLESAGAKFTRAISAQAELVLDTLPLVLGSDFLPFRGSSGQAEIPLLDRSTSWSDVLRLLWPLRMIASRSQYVPAEQFVRISQALQHISKKYGIGRSVEESHLATLSFAGLREQPSISGLSM